MIQLQLKEIYFSEAMEHPDRLPDLKSYRADKGAAYIDAPSCFDIETSSFYINAETGAFRPNLDGLPEQKKKSWEKSACMCAWTFGIGGVSVIGRTWEQFEEFLRMIKKRYGVCASRRLIIWIHNFSYEMGFIAFRFKWSKVFALSERVPVYATTKGGFEFRCTYLLSGYSLATVAKNLTQHKIEKKSGDWDYKKVRSTATPLTALERGYLLYDGYVVMCYIQEYINKVGHITSIPLTKTGAVRKLCRENCFYNKNNHHLGGNKYRRYKELMQTLQIQSVDELKQAVRAFQGGFTHANPFRVKEVISDVTSMDFTSSYPAVMLSEKFPMSKAREVKPKTAKELKNYFDNYLCVFDVDFYGLEPTILSENPLSLSKCWNVEGEEVANGRVVRASEISTTTTNIDYDYLKRFYSWRKMVIKNMRVFYPAYLPRDFLLTILDLYGKKTTLKGVQGKEVEYQGAKEHVNSLYGMMVTAINRDEIHFSDIDGWSKSAPDLEEALKKYNLSKTRFLFYWWGVFDTAYARRNLFTGIYECCGKGATLEDGSLDLTKDDYIYSDTDSVKIANFYRHKDYFDRYNATIKAKMLEMAKARDIDVSLLSPKTIEGVEKPLGVWDFDGHYKRFKTLGAKRYMVEHDDGTHNITVSGVNKKTAVPYMEDLAKEKGVDVFEIFDEDLFIPAKYTGKNIHTYIDTPTEGNAVDYLGVPFHFKEKSSIHLEETSYSLSMAEAFLNYLQGIQRL